MWTSPPFTPTEYIEPGGAPAGGPAIRARGIADDKSNLVVHLGALKAFEGKPPVAVRIVLEGQEEYGNLRIHPKQDPKEAQDFLVDHLEAVKAFGVELKITREDAGPGFAAVTDGPAYQAAKTALREARGNETVLAASGGSIPLVNGLSQAVPNAEILLFGAEDAACQLHGPNERVLVSELRNAVIAEAGFFREYAASFQ